MPSPCVRTTPRQRTVWFRAVLSPAHADRGARIDDLAGRPDPAARTGGATALAGRGGRPCPGGPVRAAPAGTAGRPAVLGGGGHAVLRRGADGRPAAEPA